MFKITVIYKKKFLTEYTSNFLPKAHDALEFQGYRYAVGVLTCDINSGSATDIRVDVFYREKIK